MNPIKINLYFGLNKNQMSKNKRLTLFGYSILLLFIVIFIDVQFFYQRQFDQSSQLSQSSTNPSIIARGEYLVYGPGRCADCHGDVSKRSEIAKGVKVDLSGGFYEDIYLGRISFPNITPDHETGIGLFSDEMISRFIRTGINHRGEYGLPFMNYQTLTPNDLTAIISFLRIQTPIKNKVERSNYNFLGKLALAYFVRPEPVKPIFSDKDITYLQHNKPSIEYGRYLVEALGSCRECHTNRNLKTGDYIGDFYSGGMPFEHSNKSELNVISPSLRPDKNSKYIAGFDKESFIKRMQAGQLKEWSPMPWGPFSRITTSDAESIYKYLSSLTPEK